MFLVFSRYFRDGSEESFFTRGRVHAGDLSSLLHAHHVASKLGSRFVSFGFELGDALPNFGANLGVRFSRDAWWSYETNADNFGAANPTSVLGAMAVHALWIGLGRLVPEAVSWPPKSLGLTVAQLCGRDAFPLPSVSYEVGVAWVRLRVCAVMEHLFSIGHEHGVVASTGKVLVSLAPERIQRLGGERVKVSHEVGQLCADVGEDDVIVVGHPAKGVELNLIALCGDAETIPDRPNHLLLRDKAMLPKNRPARHEPSSSWQDMPWFCSHEIVTTLADDPISQKD